MIELIFLIWACIIFFLCGKDTLHPAFIISSIWCLGVIVCRLSHEFYPVSTTSGLVLFLFIFESSCSSLIYSFIYGKHISSKLDFSKTAVNYNTLNLLILISIVGCISYISMYIREMLSYESLALYYYYSRMHALNDEPIVNVGWFVSQMPPLAFVTSIFVLVLFYNKKYQVSIYIMVLLFVLTAITLTITGTRSILIIYLLILVFISLQMTQFSISKYALYLLLFILIYSLSTYLMRTSETDKESLSVIESSLSSLQLYAFGGIKGFDLFLYNGSTVYHAIFDLALGPTPRDIDFVSIGPYLETNVYSVFAVYLYYFGYPLSLVLVFLVFIIVGAIYENRYRNIIFFILSCFFLTATALTTFFDYFFVLFPYIGRVIIVYYILSMPKIKYFRL